jgi:hypothetical protein
MYVDFIVSTHYSFQIVMKLEFSRQTSEKYSDIKCNEIILIYIQQDATLHSFFYLETALRTPPAAH